LGFVGSIFPVNTAEACGGTPSGTPEISVVNNRVEFNFGAYRAHVNGTKYEVVRTDGNSGPRCIDPARSALVLAVTKACDPKEEAEVIVHNSFLILSEERRR
jgi:hypothetical protein